MKRRQQKVTERLRQEIAACEKSRYRLGQETDIDPATLHRFCHGQGSLSADGIDRLAEVLDLELTRKRRPRQRKG